MAEGNHRCCKRTNYTRHSYTLQHKLTQAESLIYRALLAVLDAGSRSNIPSLMLAMAQTTRYGEKLKLYRERLELYQTAKKYRHQLKLHQIRLLTIYLEWMRHLPLASYRTTGRQITQNTLPCHKQISSS